MSANPVECDDIKFRESNTAMNVDGIQITLTYGVADLRCRECGIIRSERVPEPALDSSRFVEFIRAHNEAHDHLREFGEPVVARHRIEVSLEPRENVLDLSYVCLTCDRVSAKIRTTNVHQSLAELPAAVVEHDRGHATAASFADFVYREASKLRMRNRNVVSWSAPEHVAADEYEEQCKRLGVIRHDDINRYELWGARELKSSSGGWERLFVDDGKQRIDFPAKRLLRGDNPLRCKPDVILLKPTARLALVVERKCPNAGVPRETYLNHKAQLWCYGHIDALAGYEVLLVCEYWLFKGRPQKQLHDDVTRDVPAPLRHYHHGDATFDRECAEQFIRFGGIRTSG